MKNTFVISFVLITVVSCSKKETMREENQDIFTKAPYDTTAIDSFSSGAISVNVAENIRRSSKAYQDSLLQIKLKQEQERKEKEEQAKMEKAAKDALEKEAKKQAEASTTTLSDQISTQ